MKKTSSHIEMYESGPMLERINNDFSYHAPSGTQVERYEGIRSHGRQMALTIMHLVPPSRECALALTKLEEAVMWANAAIARNESPDGEPQ